MWQPMELLFLCREAEKKNKDVYEDLPLFVIEQTYGSTEAGRKLVCKMILHCHVVKTYVCMFASLLAKEIY